MPADRDGVSFHHSLGRFRLPAHETDVGDLLLPAGIGTTVDMNPDGFVQPDLLVQKVDHFFQKPFGFGQRQIAKFNSRAGNGIPLKRFWKRAQPFKRGSFNRSSTLSSGTSVRITFCVLAVRTEPDP